MAIKLELKKTSAKYRLLKYLMEHKQANASELGHALQTSYQTTYNILGWLIKEKIVDYVQEERKLYRLIEEIELIPLDKLIRVKKTQSNN